MGDDPPAFPKVIFQTYRFFYFIFRDLVYSWVNARSLQGADYLDRGHLRALNRDGRLLSVIAETDMLIPAGRLLCIGCLWPARSSTSRITLDFFRAGMLGGHPRLKQVWAQTPPCLHLRLRQVWAPTPRAHTSAMGGCVGKLLASRPRASCRPSGIGPSILE